MMKDGLARLEKEGKEENKEWLEQVVDPERGAVCGELLSTFLYSG
jgi:hypothetical protein